MSHCVDGLIERLRNTGCVVLLPFCAGSAALLKVYVGGYLKLLQPS
jgi:hypothetical protein